MKGIYNFFLFYLFFFEYLIFINKIHNLQIENNYELNASIKMIELISKKVFYKYIWTL